MKLTREAKDALAAEYVLGTLRGRARRRFEAIARGDAEARDLLARWEAGLTPLAEGGQPVEPPARVWKAIESRIGVAKAESGETGFWRTIGLLAAGLAASLVVATLWLAPPRDGDPELVAVLTASDSVPRMVVDLRSTGELHVRVVNPWKSIEGRSLELWAVPKSGPPRSLGLVENARDTRLRLAPSDARLVSATAFAVSLEPRGGSTTGQPTGPVLCSGAIAATRKT